MTSNHSPSSILERQGLHALLLGAMLVILWWFADSCEWLAAGTSLGLSATAWFWIAIAEPIAHQLWVLIFWRLELHRGSITRFFGNAGFPLYGAGFTILILGRLVVLFFLSDATRNTLEVNRATLEAVAVLISVPIVFTMYSIVRYFGFKRAYGADHFEESYRSMPLVKRGIFRYTSNAMYVFGLMAVYLPGLLLASGPALVAGLFNHAYIWVHYFTVEKPDMRVIYGSVAE